MKVYVYFDGSFQGTFVDLLDAIKRLKLWFKPVSNPQIFDPITIVER